MTDISATSQQTLDSLLKKLGATPATTTSKTPHKTQLDQSDFLKLMTAQLSNQDPFQPQSNDQMIAQMAQFSTVSGITQLNTTMSGIQSTISDNRIATAANFVGKTVLVPGNVALPDDAGAISGAVDLPTNATGLNLQITKENGELVKSIDLGANNAGLVGFQWDGNDAKGAKVGAARYYVKATMTAAGKQAAAATDVYAPITEATVGTSTADQQFTIAGLGKVNLTDIKSFKY